MKIITWNVNGIRAALKKGFLDFVKREDADIICLQETKANDFQIELPGYRQYWNSAEKRGYSGTAVFSRAKPENVWYDMPGHSSEGRIITVEYGDFVLVNVYVPNAQRGLARLDYRQEWDRDFADFLAGFAKPVVACGDFNVAHTEIDLARPKDNTKNAGFSPEERNGFTRLLEMGFSDAWRKLHPGEVQYTWWSYMFNARAKGIGWRIDYFVVSNGFMKNVNSIDIMDDVMGSDHCPVKLVLRD